MILTPDGAGGFRANGGKYYIGNGNLAGMVSVFGRRADLDGPEGYVFFAADSQHPAYHLAQNVVASRRSPTCGRGLTDAYARLVAMKLFADRAIDYFRSAGPDDRRYLLFNPLTKMKVTTEGERVIDGLWDVIAVKGFEKDTYFEMAARDMRSLPKLEGTVHVNMALVLKFMANYLFKPASYVAVPPRRGAADDSFFWRQGPTRGLGEIRFHDWRPAYDDAASIPNVAMLREQAEDLCEVLLTAPPDGAQQRDLDFTLTLGELFTLVVYGHLVLEQAAITGLDRMCSTRSSTCWCGTSRRTPSDFTARRRRLRRSRPGRCARCASRLAMLAASTGSGPSGGTVQRLRDVPVAGLRASYQAAQPQGRARKVTGKGGTQTRPRRLHDHQRRHSLRRDRTGSA